MKKNLLSVVLVLAFSANFLTAQTVWNGPTMTFSKMAFADPTQAANQDRMTASTWITRGSIMGIYNAVAEAGYTDFVSPTNTEWATGTLANRNSLTYETWENWNNSNPPSMVGVPAVLHLITENIYIGITFTAWGQGAGGGGSFTYQRTTAPITAPVKLTGFTASKKNNQLLLNWNTASEENTSFFDIERSSDDKQFTSIGMLPASGNSNEEKNYAFTDATPLASNFYRLKTVDNNGSFSFSNIIAFKFGKIKKLDFFPVPASTGLNIQLDVLAQTNLLIADAAGRTRKTKAVAKGNNAFTLDISDLEPGIYFLKIENETKTFIKE